VTYINRRLQYARLLEKMFVAILFMALATPISAALADRVGRRPVLLISAVAAAAVGLMMPALLAQGPAGVLAFLSLALGAMGLTFAPLGAATRPAHDDCRSSPRSAMWLVPLNR
jgi:MFS family permease